MKILIEPTAECVLIGAMPCRVWNGQTEAGVPCLVYVCLVRVDQVDDVSEFDRDLIDVPLSAANLPRPLNPERN